jgi:hypothetical protein
VARHPIEVQRAVLDGIEDATEPGPRGLRIFPYTHVVVSVATRDAHHRATTEAVFVEPPSLEARVRERLRHLGCANAETVSVVTKLVGVDAWEGADGEYRLDFRRQPLNARRAPKMTTQSALHLSVMCGKANRMRFAFTDARINLGRLDSVVDRQQRVVRHNHVAFADDDEVNQSVSRAHAHLEFDPSTGAAIVHDDGSTHGTRVVRSGRTLEVPRGGRGLRVRDADELVLGRARLRISFRSS